jgi:excisionase family DNA binding protein
MMTAANDNGSEPEVLNADQLAEMLGLDRNTVYDAANRGDIPHRRVGRRLLFSRAAILVWLQGNNVVRKA